MIEKQMNGLTPTKLRIVLFASMVVLVIAAAIGFWFFKGWLTSFAQDVHSKSVAATVSSNDIANLQSLETQLEQDSVAVNRTKNIVADSKFYQYQNQIITDINAYAKSAGITISGYTFSSAGSSPGGSAASAATPSSTTAPAVAAPAGIKTTSVSITVKNPVDYKAVMRFIHAIELNLTKMQLTGISLAKGDNASSATINPLTLEVYIQ